MATQRSSFDLWDLPLAGTVRLELTDGSEYGGWSVSYQPGNAETPLAGVVIRGGTMGEVHMPYIVFQRLSERLIKMVDAGR